MELTQNRPDLEPDRASKRSFLQANDLPQPRQHSREGEHTPNFRLESLDPALSNENPETMKQRGRGETPGYRGGGEQKVERRGGGDRRLSRRRRSPNLETDEAAARKSRVWRKGHTQTLHVIYSAMRM